MDRSAISRWLREHPRAADLALALAVAAIALTAHLAGPERVGSVPRRDATWWTISLVVAATAPIYWRRSRPVATASIIVVAQIACELLRIHGSDWIALLIAAYSLASHATEPLRTRAAVVLGALIGLLLLSGAIEGEIGVGILLGTAAMVAAAFLFGDNIRRRRLRLEDLADRAERAEREQELVAAARVREERSRLARELHDVVAHSVSVMIIQAGAARRNLHEHPDAAADVLHEVEATGRRAMDELRRVLGVLRSSDGSAPGHEFGPQPGFADLDPLVGATGLPVALSIDPAAHDLPAGLAVSGYRIVQEALTNVHRHAGPVDVVEVTVAVNDGALDVRIDDDGRGAANDAANPNRRTADGPIVGFGIAGMRERADALGGSVWAGPRQGGGWRVHARIPANNAEVVDVQPAVRSTT